MNRRLITGIIGVPEGSVAIPREFGIDGKPNKAAILRRKFDSVFHHIAAAGNRCHIFAVLLRGKDVLQDGAKLHFPQNSTGFHIAEDLFEVADALGQRLHFTQTAVNLFQPVIHQAEGFGHAVIEGFLQLFIDGLAHFVQLGIIILANGGKLAFHGRTYILQRARGLLGECG